MKKVILFAVLCSVLLLLVPMVSSVETRLVEDEIEEKVKENLFSFGIDRDIFGKINFLDNPSLFLKLYIFLLLGFCLGFAVRELINNTGDLIDSLIWGLIMGLLFFPMSLIDLFSGIVSGSVIATYLIGLIIFLIIEISNPNFINYMKGLMVFAFFFNLIDIIIMN